MILYAQIYISFIRLVPSSSVRNLTTSTTHLNGTSILVTWSVPLLNDLNGVLLNYSINYSGIEIDTVPRVIYLSNPGFADQSFILTNLEEYTTYSINISGYTKVGKSPDAIVKHRTSQDGELFCYLNLVFFSCKYYIPFFSSICYSHFILCECHLSSNHQHNLGTSSSLSLGWSHHKLHTHVQRCGERHFSED